MPDISKIQLPSGNTYDIKDAYARQLIAGGTVFSIAWDGSSTPTVANIPYGITVTYNETDYTGTKTASSSDVGTFFLVKSGTAPNKYDEFVVIRAGAGTTLDPYTYSWEQLGSDEVDLSGLGSLAYKDSVTLSTGDGDVVLGESTTFTAASSSVTFSGGSTDKCLGSDATFTTSVTPTTTNIKATASGTAVGASGTDTFVKSYPGATSKLVTTTVPNVTSAGSASTWAFALGTGDDSETLIISGANGSAPTLGTAKTVATGSLDSNGGGGSVMTGLGTATTASAVTGVSVTSQPTVALSTGATAGTGVISVATGITSASTSVNSKDEVTAITSIGTGTAAAQSITVGTNDKVTVAKKSDLSVTVS